MASSRVGDITSVPVPLRGMNFARCISSMQGTRNASVLPDPACHTQSWASPWTTCRFTLLILQSQKH